MSVGSNIRKRRFELRMSQQELATLMGYKTRSTIAKIESGENDVSQKKLLKFAAVLETTVEALVSGYDASMGIMASAISTENNTGERKCVAVILAGGKSGNNRQNIPSQFIDVQGKPIIVYSMDAYQSHPSINDIYVVCVRGWENIVMAYAKQFGISKLRGIIAPGHSGTASLKNAIDCLKNRYDNEDLFFIQEATRPLVSVETISKLLQASAETGSATTCHSMRDYVQFCMKDGKASYLERSSIISLQSPEVHKLSLINKIYEKALKNNHPFNESCFTMLMQNLGFGINFTESDINNIKIMRQEDIAAFGALVKQ